MVIQCPECRTRFKLADEKVKPGGVKVRCARCRHVFAVQSAALDEAAPLAPFSAQAASGTAFAAVAGMGTPSDGSPGEGERWPQAPPPEPDRPSLDELSERGDLFGEDAEDEGAFAPAPQDEPFADFAPLEESAFAPAADPFGEEAGPARDAFGSGDAEGEIELSWGKEEEASRTETDFGFSVESPEGDPFAEEGGARKNEGKDLPAPDPFGAGEKGREDDEPFSFDISAADAAPAVRDDFSFSDETESSRDFSFSPAGSDAWETPGEKEGTASFASAAPGKENDEFDFSEVSFPEDSPAAAPEAPTPPAPETPPPAAVQPAPAIKPAPPSASRATPAAKKPTAPRRKKQVSGVFLFLLLLLALAGAASYAYWSLGPEKIRGYLESLVDRPAPAPAPSRIRLIELKGFFVQNAHEGQLFAITGQAVNDHSEARSAIAVKGILYDDKGQPLLQQTVFAGNPLPEETLRQAPFSKIEEGMNNQFGDSLSNLNVASGKAIPFTIVFKGLPPKLTEFTVEVADSRPGSK